MSSPLKLLIIGLDGADLALLRGLQSRAPMRAIGQLLTDGSSGPLMSTIPPSSPAAWSSIVTGELPGVHGVFHFREPLDEQGQRPLITTASIRSECIWRHLSRDQVSMGILHLPVMYPAEPSTGFSVSGMLTPRGSDRWITPRDLLDPVVRELGAPCFHAEEEDEEAFAAALSASARHTTQLALFLQRAVPVDVLFPVFVLPDRILHRFGASLCAWVRGQGSGIFPSGHLLRAFESLDQAVAELVSTLKPSLGVLMLSDHGFGKVQRVICVNAILREMGLAHFRASEDPLPGVLKGGIETHVDWDRTVAYLSSPLESGLIINGTVGQSKLSPGSSRKRSVVDLLHRTFTEMVDPVTRLRLFELVARREDLYRGPHARRAPEIMLISREEEALLSEDPRSSGFLRAPGARESGMHRREGFWSYTGPFQEGWADQSRRGCEEILGLVMRMIGQSNPFRAPSPSGRIGDAP